MHYGHAQALLLGPPPAYNYEPLAMYHPIGVWSREGPKPTSESVLRVPNLDGDARRVHEGLSWFGQKEGPTSSGEGGVLYFLAPKCLHRGYKL
jgi:hypothetical protein